MTWVPRGGVPLDFPVFLFVLLSIVSTSWAAYPWAAYQLAMNILCVALCYFLLRCIGVQTDGAMEAKWLMAVVLLSGTLQLIYVVIQSYFLHVGRPAGTFDNPNFLADYLFFCVVISLHFAAGDSSRGLTARKILFPAIAVLMGCGVYLTHSRAMAAVAVGTFLFLVLIHRGKRKYRYLLGAAGGTAALLMAVASRFSTAVDPYTLARLNIWKAAWKTALAHPFGVGLGGYPFYWFRFRDPIENVPFRYWKTANTAHSQFFGILSELGFPGIFLALAVACPVIYLVWRESRREDRILPLCFIPLGAMIHAFFDVNLNVFAVALPVAACAALLANRNIRTVENKIHIPQVLRAGLAFIMLLCIGYSAATFLGYSHYEKGMDLLKRGKTDLAFRDFSSARRFDPLSSSYPDAVSSVYYRWFLQTRREEYLAVAVNMEQEAHAASPENPLHLSQVGFLLGELAKAVPGEEDRRRYRSFALAALNDSLQKDPYSIIALKRLAEIHRGAGEEAEARVVLERLIATEPNFVRAYLMLAGLEEAKNPGKAADNYRKAIALSLAFENKQLELGQRELFQIDRQGVRRRLDALEGRQIPSNAEGQ
jgi:O-antigen ligase